MGTGRRVGDACVVASHTLVLMTLKLGLFTGAGRDHAGAIWFDALGADAADRVARTNRARGWRPARARIDSHQNAGTPSTWAASVTWLWWVAHPA